METEENCLIKTLHVTPEFAPLAQKGGLGEVLGSLPKALRKNGVDARVLLPAWRGVLDAAKEHGSLSSKPLGTVAAALDWRAVTARVWKATLSGVPVYILENDELFGRYDIYPDNTTAETAEPMIFLSYAAFELSKGAKWRPQIIHAHDWPTAVIPSALRWHRCYSKRAGDFDTVFTIHNMAHQGLFQRECLDGWGFRPDSYSALDPASLEFYGLVNLMKGALVTAEAITTVSPSYSWDVQTREGGFGLDGVMSANKSKLRGILNGIDYDIWNPEKDPLIPAHFSSDNTEGKAECKRALLNLFNLEDDGRALVVFVGRLAEQKGVDIMTAALERFMNDKVYALIIGSGSEYYNRKVTDFAEAHAGSVRTVMEFSEEKAHLAYAGGDILLMPSLFEPCGLSQMIALAYGTVPVVRATGGLADTVIDADASPDGTGFLFRDYSITELEEALKRALAAKSDPAEWRRIVKNAMKKDFSWNASAKEYVKLYEDIISAD